MFQTCPLGASDVAWVWKKRGELPWVGIATVETESQLYANETLIHLLEPKEPGIHLCPKEAELFHFLCQERTRPTPLSLVTEPLDPRHPKYMDGSEGTETAPSQCPLLTDRDHSWEPRGNPEQGNGADNNYSNAECQFSSLGSSIKTHNSKRHVGPASRCLSAGTDCLGAGVMELQAHWTH